MESNIPDNINSPESLRRPTAVIVLVALCGLCVLFITGMLHDRVNWLAQLHHWIGVIFPLMVGLAGIMWLVSQPWKRRGVGALFLRVSYVSFLTLVSFSNSFTGYLGPSVSTYEPTINRFYAIHCVIEPIIIGLMLMIWYRQLCRDTCA